MGVTELERGKTYWKVLKAINMGKENRINKIIVLGKTRLSVNTNMPMVDVIEFPKRHKYIKNSPRATVLFLEDYNIPENNYNQNRIFASHAEAQAYAAR